jgi:hypothetical protein
MSGLLGLSPGALTRLSFRPAPFLVWVVLIRVKVLDIVSNFYSLGIVPGSSADAIARDGSFSVIGAGAQICAPGLPGVAPPLAAIRWHRKKS